LDDEANSIRYAVTDRKALYDKFAKLKCIPGFKPYKLGIMRGGPALLELNRYDALGKTSAVNGNVELGKDIGQSANMVFVAMGNNNTPDPLTVLQKIAYVRYDQIYAQHILFREHYTGIDNDDILAIL
jgi:hypothetical protein